MQRGASMTTDKHVDPAVAPQIIEEENQDTLDADIPEGALRFNLTAEEIKEAMIEASTEVVTALNALRSCSLMALLGPPFNITTLHPVACDLSC